MKTTCSSPPREPSLRGRLIGGGAWAFGSRIAGMAAGICVNALLARLLSPDDLGAFFLSVSMVTLGSLFASMGLPQTVIRFVGESLGLERPGRARQALMLILLLSLAGTTAAVILCVSGAWEFIADYLFESGTMRGVALPAALWLAAMTFQSIMVESLRGLNDLKYASIFGGFLTQFISLCTFGIAWLLSTRIDLHTAILVTASAAGLTAAGAGLHVYRHVARFPTRPEESISATQILEVTWPIWITAILGALNQADIWILGLFRPQDQVAIYGAAARLMFLVTFPLLMVNAVLPPVIASMYAARRRDELQRILRMCATVAAIPSATILLVCLLAGGQLLKFIYGDFYSSGHLILALLSTGQFINVWSGACAMTLMLTGYQQTMMHITLASGCFTVTASALAAKFLGPEGVAAAAASGIILQSLSTLYLAKKRTGLWTHSDILLVPRLPSAIKSAISEFVH